MSIWEYLTSEDNLKRCAPSTIAAAAPVAITNECGGTIALEGRYAQDIHALISVSNCPAGGMIQVDHGLSPVEA